MNISLLDRITITTASSKAKVDLLKDIARNLEQDMPIPDIASDFIKYGSSLEKLVGLRMRAMTEKGHPTYMAFDGVVSNLAYQTLQTGEGTEQLSVAFLKAAKAIESSEALFMDLALSYVVPMIKVACIFIIVAVISNEIFSQLKMILPQARWPGMSKSFYSLITIIYQNWISIIAGMLAFWITTYSIMKNTTGVARSYIDKLPFFKQYRVLTASGVLAQLSTLLNAGKPMLEAVRWVGANQDRYGKWHLRKMEKNILEAKNSGNLGHILDTGLINEREVYRLRRSIPDNQIGDILNYTGINHNITLKRGVDIVKVVASIVVKIIGLSMMLWFFSSVFFLILSVS